MEEFGPKPAGKYYRLTAAGKKQLVAEQSKWKLLVGAITRVMRPAQGGLIMRCGAFGDRKQRDTDLDDEIAHDLAAEAEERIRSGIAARRSRTGQPPRFRERAAD